MKYTELEKRNQELTEDNTKLKEQVGNQVGQLQDLKDHQTQLIADNALLKAQNEAFTQQLQTLTQDKKALQDENAELRRGLANPPPVNFPITTWRTNQGDDRSWDDVAKRFRITTAELFRLNPEINANTQFNFDKLLNVPKV